MSCTIGEWIAIRRGMMGRPDECLIFVKAGGAEIPLAEGINEKDDADLIAAAVNGCISANPNNPQAVALSIKPMYELCQRVARFRTTPDNALGMYEFLASVIEQAVGILNKSI